MKPKNRVMCPDCGKQKMLFETERKANDFIKWNGDEIDTKGGELRAYYCPSCCGWHISHQTHKDTYDTNTDRLLGAFERAKKANKSIENKIDIALHRNDYNYLSPYTPIEKKKEIAEKIYFSIPSTTRLSITKKEMKDYVSEFYANNDILENDGGAVRRMVYEMMMQRL